MINFNLATFLLFVTSVIGFTHIIVDPAVIAKPFRDFVKKNCYEWVDKLFSCYQCCGTWVGFFCGTILISFNPFVIFICGMAGSFIASFGASYLNYIEAQSLLSIKDDD